MAHPVQRRLVLLRHAKSAWPHGVPDEDRPLSGRGRRDAQAAGQWLATEGPRPDLTLCSTAVRTRHTWEIVRRSLPPVPTRYLPELYTGDADEVLDVVAAAPASVRTLVIVGHEPATSVTALRLAGRRSDRRALEALADKFPTSALAVLRFDGDWTGLRTVKAALETFTVPRG
ncbi:MAG TPA: histidine phosphatase family protein [Kineosporiaceae bacterium]|nr:histidine phosphatase family protein [Kineosporiaceae bacterium]